MVLEKSTTEHCLWCCHLPRKKGEEGLLWVDEGWGEGRWRVEERIPDRAAPGRQVTYSVRKQERMGERSDSERIEGEEDG